MACEMHDWRSDIAWRCVTAHANGSDAGLPAHESSRRHENDDYLTFTRFDAVRETIHLIFKMFSSNQIGKRWFRFTCGEN